MARARSRTFHACGYVARPGLLPVFPRGPLDFFRAIFPPARQSRLVCRLLSAIHLLLFATIVRLYSATTNRDYAFLTVLAVTSMLASAILTVETGFLVALALFLVLAVSTFVALEIRRSSAGAVAPPFDPGSPLAHKLNRALGITSVLVAVSALAIGMVIFFLIPRFTTGYLSALNLQPNLMTGFSDNVTLGDIGKIQQNSSVVMRIRIDGDPAGAQDVHWRGIAPHQFRRTSLVHAAARRTRSRIFRRRRLLAWRGIDFRSGNPFRCATRS